jgi:hypothetical protein
MSNHPPRATRSSREPLLQLLLAMVWLLAAALILSELAAGLFRPWNDIRLAPSAGLLQGHPLYLTATQAGPIWSWIYGPVAPVFYLPAVLLPTPATAVSAALLMTAVVFLAAGRVLITRSSFARGLPREAAFAAFVLYTLGEPALRGAGYSVHADAPAIALAALACAVILPVARRDERRALSLSALASVLAVATKQVLLPLPFTIVLYLACTGGWSRAGQWLVPAAFWAGLVTLLSLLCFGPDALAFNLVTIPAAHPWQWGGGASALATSGLEWILRAWPFALLVVCEGTARDRTKPWRHEPRALLLWVGIGLSLGGILTRAKVGADVNAHAFGLFFLAIAAAGALADACTSASAPRRRAAQTALAIGLAAASWVALPTALQLPAALRALPLNPETTGAMLAREAPGTLYFPSHPLIPLYEERRASHVGYGVFDRDLAGQTVREELFAAFTAPKLARVALWAVAEDPVLRRLPTLTVRSQRGPGGRWTLFEAPLSDQSSP